MKLLIWHPVSHGNRVTRCRIIQLLPIILCILQKQSIWGPVEKKNEFNYTIKTICFIYMTADIITVWWCFRPFPTPYSFMWINELWVAKCTRTIFSNSAPILAWAEEVFCWKTLQWMVFVGQAKVCFWWNPLREPESASFSCLQVGEGRKCKTGRNTFRAKTFASHRHYQSVITTKT